MCSIYDKSLGLMAGITIPSSRTSTLWALGEILTYKTRTHHESGGSIVEITGTCPATEVVEEPASGREATEAIIKIKIQYIAPSI